MKANVAWSTDEDAYLAGKACAKKSSFRFSSN